MTAIAPDWPHKMLALQSAVHWASGRAATVVFRDSNAADAARQSGRPWITLAVDRITAVGQDTVEVEAQPVGDPIEVYSGQRDFTIELRAYSREQALGLQAWYLADQVRTRLRRSVYAREQWLEPNNIAIREMRNVVNMSPRLVDGRAESEAVLELELSTAIRESDAANATTWIETVLLSSTGLPDDLVNDPIT